MSVVRKRSGRCGQLQDDLEGRTDPLFGHQVHSALNNLLLVGLHVWDLQGSQGGGGGGAVTTTNKQRRLRANQPSVEFQKVGPVCAPRTSSDLRSDTLARIPSPYVRPCSAGQLQLDLTAPSPRWRPFCPEDTHVPTTILANRRWRAVSTGLWGPLSRFGLVGDGAQSSLLQIPGR